MPIVRLLLLAVFLPTIAHASPSSPTYDVNTVEPGGLYFATETPGRVVPAPSLKANVHMDVSGPVVRTRVTQFFKNRSKAWVEGIYTYPLPKGSAIDVLKMQVGNRIIEGEIKEKAEAQRTFEQASLDGKRASLVVQRRPNIFSTRIANIGPGETIEVTIEYQDLITPRDNVFELRFPMVVRPRYTPGIPLDDVQARAGWGFDTDQVPDGSTLNPPWVDGAQQNHNPVSLSVSLSPGFALDQLSSPSHDISVVQQERQATVTLANGDVPADQDFILRWSPMANSAPQLGVFEEGTDQGSHTLVMLLPPTDTTASQDLAPRNLVIVLDKSGSMGGQAIRHAKAAVRRAILRMRNQDTFNVIAFDSTAQALFDTSQPVTDRTIDDALDFVGNMQAGGGTNMAEALTLALPADIDRSEKLKQVIFITDGAVGNEAALMAQIKNELGDARLFTVGIGSAPNSYFMSEAAHFGRGTFINIAMQDDVMTAMAGLFAKIEKPQLTYIKISGLSNGMDMAPETIPDLYAGEPIVLALKGDIANTIHISGTQNGTPWSMAVPAAQRGTAAGVASLWARRKIQALNRSYIGKYSADDQTQKRTDILRLALAYHLVSDFTSLVAVEQEAARPSTEQQFRREVSQNLPAGMDWAERKRMTISRGLIAADTATDPAVRPRASASPMMLNTLFGLLLLLLSLASFMLTRRHIQVRV